MELLSYKRLKELGYDDAKNRDCLLYTSRFQIYYFKLQCAVKRCCESNRVAVEILREKERRKL